MEVGEYLFTAAQLICVLVYAICAKYNIGISPDTPASKDGTVQNLVQQLYPFFQDVHVMIFIGFGFLMTFIKTMSWTALSYNWIISIWALQWGIIFNDFWHQVIGGKDLVKVDVTLQTLIIGDFGAGAAMITFGVLLGKANLQQLLFLIFWQMLWWGLNLAIGEMAIKGMDTGGSIFVHSFGAYFGLAASFFFQPDRARVSNNLKDSYQSNTVAMIGSIFLWIYWPSFNSALTTGNT